MSRNSDRILWTGRRFRVVACTYPDAAGAMHTREVVRHPGSVVIVPMLANDCVGLIRNYRPAIGRP